MFKKNSLMPFYIYYFIIGLHDIVAPTLYIYFANKGISFLQVSVLFAVSFFCGALSEIPTGAFADIYGRKKSVLIGLFLEAIFVFFAIYSKSFIALCILFAYWGIVYTFITGADEAWFVDSIKKDKTKVLGRRNSIRNAGIFLAGVLSSLFLTTFPENIDLIWFFRAVISFIAIAILIFFTNEKVKRIYHPIKAGYNSVYKQSLTGIKHLIKTKNLVIIVIGGVFFTVALEALGIANQPFYQDVKLPMIYWGYIMSIASVLGIIFPLFAEKLLKILHHEKYFLIVITSLNTLVFGLTYFVIGPIGAVSIILFSWIFHVIKGPVESSYTHDHIPSGIRATTASAISLTISLASAIGLILGGFLTDLVGGKMTIVFLSILLFGSAISYIFLKR